MHPILDLWQHLPSHVHPDIFSLGPIPIRWYSLMYMVALAVVYLLTSWRIRRGEIHTPPDPTSLFDLILSSIVGIILGGRLGYVFVYDPMYYVHHPAEAILPFSWQGGFHYTGFTGMSYHGALIGVVLVFLVMCRKRGWSLSELGDNLVPAVPLGYTFGRLGNFFNGELYGRVTTSAIGMYYPTAPGPGLRFPSELFEAAGEGLLLFVILWPLRNFKPYRGFLLGLYLVGYGVVRFLVEFTREPDPQLGFVLGPFSMGQILCFLMAGAGAIVMITGWWNSRRTPAPAKRRR